VYSAGLDNNITAWELRKGAAGLTLQGHADTVTGLRVSPEGNHLLSNSMDNTLRVWDMRPYAPANRCALRGSAQGWIETALHSVVLLVDFALKPQGSVCADSLSFRLHFVSSGRGTNVWRPAEVMGCALLSLHKLRVVCLLQVREGAAWPPAQL
jgi:WD40 repeat protein